MIDSCLWILAGSKCLSNYVKEFYNSYKAVFSTKYSHRYLPASLETQYGCLLFVEINWWITLTISGRIGALKTDGREIVSPDASFLSV